MGWEHIAEKLAAAMPGVVNHLWQSTVITMAAGLVILVLRGNSARTRYWVWLTASMKFLLPFSLIVVLGARLAVRHDSPVNTTQSQFYAAMDTVNRPFTVSALPSGKMTAPVVMTHWHLSRLDRWALLPGLLAAVWFCGFAVVLSSWTLRWLRVRRIRQAARPMTEGREVAALRRMERRRGLQRELPILSSRETMEPGVFGVWRPVLLWPERISNHLEQPHLEAIFAHELEHVKQRDNLFAMAHMLVQAVFWFHPLVWWMGRQLVAEREHACDEEVLRMGSAPVEYAESILKTCKFCVESPLPCVSGVTGADLKKRIVQIMSKRMGSRLSAAKKILVTVAGMAVITGPLVFGLVYSAQVHAQAAAAAVKNDPKDLTGTWQGTLNNGKELRMVFKMTTGDGGWKTGMFSIDEGAARSTGLTTLHDGSVHYALPANVGFYDGKINADGSAISGTWTMNGKTLPLNLVRVSEAAAWDIPPAPEPIKPMAADADPGFDVATIKPSIPNRPGKGFGFRGTHFVTGNTNLNDLIAIAYGFHAKEIVGAPEWAGTELYDLDGIPDVPGRPSDKQRGLMLQKLLRDRFNLKFHTEKRELPVYIITVANGAPKMAKATREANDPSGFGFKGLGDLVVMNLDMTHFATWMQSAVMDRPVVDQTGLTDRYDFQLKWTPDQSQFEQFRGTGVPMPKPNDDPNAPPSLYTAMQEQLGLKMAAGKAPVDVMVIDHVEKPSAN